MQHFKEVLELGWAGGPVKNGVYVFTPNYAQNTMTFESDSQILTLEGHVADISLPSLAGALAVMAEQPTVLGKIAGKWAMAIIACLPLQQL